MTKTGSRWLKLSLTPSQISQTVAALRCGLDKTLWYGDRAGHCRDLVKAEPARYENGAVKWETLPFDRPRAQGLYKALLGPFEDLIAGKHLLVVPDGALTRLPFGVLMVDESSWLGTRQPITVLPSVTSLTALRGSAKASRATKAYLAVANPLLDGDPSTLVTEQQKQVLAKRVADARAKQSCPTAAPATTAPVETASLAEKLVQGFTGLFSRGAASADIEAVRKAPPLPETRDEVCEVGRGLGAQEGDFLLGARATESAIKNLSEQGALAQHAILHFATHGVLAGQIKGSAEPGLVLTPPPKEMSDPEKLARDDGYLTASETATLNLDADWVILSACNTAAGSASGETGGGEALSGLARAFFYAGARALLVSHWEVDSKATVDLATRAFAELKGHPEIGRAEALRRSMVALIGDGTSRTAHPAFWAPFVVVGEGGTAK